MKCQKKYVLIFLDLLMLVLFSAHFLELEWSSPKLYTAVHVHRNTLLSGLSSHCGFFSEKGFGWGLLFALQAKKAFNFFFINLLTYQKSYSVTMRHPLNGILVSPHYPPIPCDSLTNFFIFSKYGLEVKHVLFLAFSPSFNINSN